MDYIAHDAPLLMGFPRQEDWSGLPFPSPGDLPGSGVKPVSPALTSRSISAKSPGNPCLSIAHAQLPSHVQLFETPWTIAYQAPLSFGFPRQEYWSELPFLSPGDLPHPGIEPESPALAGGFFTPEPPEKSYLSVGSSKIIDPWH